MPSHAHLRWLSLWLFAGFALLSLAAPPAASQAPGRIGFERQVADSLGALKFTVERLAQTAVDATAEAPERAPRADRAAALYEAAAGVHNDLVDRIGRDVESGTRVTYDRYASAFDSVRAARQALGAGVDALTEADSVAVTARSGAVVHGIGSMVRTAWHALVTGAQEIRGRSASGRGGAGATRGRGLSAEDRAQLAALFRNTYSLPAFESFAPTAEAGEGTHGE